MNYKSTFIDMKGEYMADWNDTNNAFVAESFEMEQQLFLIYLARYFHQCTRCPVCDCSLYTSAHANLYVVK